MITNVVGVPVKFGGGLNTLSGPLNIADDQSPNCKNVHSNLAKTLQRRNGFASLGTVASGVTGNGLFDYWYTSSTHYLMGYFGKYLYKMDAPSNILDGTFDNISLGTEMSNSILEFEQFNQGGVSYLIMASHARDKLQKFRGGDAATTDLSADTDLVKPKYIKQWLGYLFCANIENYESRVYYNITSGTIVGSTDWSSTDYQDIRTNDGDYIGGQAILRGRLYTFKKYSIHRWTYLGSTPLFSVKTAVSGTGCISSKTIVNISHPKYGEILVFLGSDGKFYIFDGNMVLPISTNIENDNKLAEFNLARIDKNYIDEACAVNYSDKHWYVCYAPVGSINNWAIVWDYYSDSWWVFDNMDARATCVAESGGSKNVYFVSDDAYAYRFDYGNSDNGSNIVANYDTKKLTYDNTALLKASRYLEMQFKNSNATIDIYNKSDWAETWGTAEIFDVDAGGFILGTSLLGTGILGGPTGITRTKDLPSIDHFEQFRLRSNSADVPWHLFAADVVVRGAGYGGSG